MKKFILVAALGLCGCVSNSRDLGDTFGAAFAANNDAMIIDKTAAAGAPATDGATVDLAILRYKTDKVKRPSGGQFKAGATNTGGGPQQ